MADGRTSYRLGEATYADVDAELARLEAQAGLAWPQEADALRRHGLAPDAEVLEAGCGPGFVTTRLLELLPKGRVTALDADSRMVELARARIGSDSRVTLAEASAIDTGLAGGSFDAVVARFLLQHLPEPEAALEEFRRLLRPGGRLIVVDTEDAFSLVLDPEPPFLREVMDAVGELQRLQGGDRRIGRRLPNLLAATGFTELAFDAVFAHSAIVGFEAIRRVLADQVIDRLEAAALLSADTVRAVRAFQRALDTGEIEVAGALGFVVASGATPAS